MKDRGEVVKMRRGMSEKIERVGNRLINDRNFKRKEGIQGMIMVSDGRKGGC